MRIKSLRLENFRGFEKCDVDLNRPISVLFGESGSGKTTVLDALRWILTEVLKRNWGPQCLGWGWAPDIGDLRVGTDAGLVRAEFLIEQVNHACYFTYVRDEQALKTTGAAPEIGKRSLQMLLPIAYDVTRGLCREQPACACSNPLSAELALHCRPQRPHPLADTIHASQRSFQSFFTWFQELEDAENRLKVQRRDLDARDPKLSAVRHAVEYMMPGYSGLRMHGEPAHLAVCKGNTVLSIHQLSEGEKALIMLTADIARRLTIAYPKAEHPLRDGEAVVLVDEIELYLGAHWQRSVLPTWHRLFPKCQFIVSTQSAEVAASVPGDHIVPFEPFGAGEVCPPPPKAQRRREQRHTRKTKLARLWKRSL